MNKRLGAVLMAALALAACKPQQTLDARAPEDDAQCRSLKYEPGTQGYLECRKMLMSQHQADIENAQVRQATTRGIIPRAAMLMEQAQAQ